MSRTPLLLQVLLAALRGGLFNYFTILFYGNRGEVKIERRHFCGDYAVVSWE